MAESQILNIATLKTLPRRSSVDFLKADVVTIGPLKMLLDVPILCKRVELADESGKISLCFLGPSAKSFDEWFPEVKAGKFLKIRNLVTDLELSADRKLTTPCLKPAGNMTITVVERGEPMEPAQEEPHLSYTWSNCSLTSGSTSTAELGHPNDLISEAYFDGTTRTTAEVATLTDVTSSRSLTFERISAKLDLINDPEVELEILKRIEKLVDDSGRQLHHV